MAGVAVQPGAAIQFDKMVSWEATNVDHTMGVNLVPGGLGGGSYVQDEREQRSRSTSRRNITLKILGGTEEIVVPALVMTFAKDVRELIASRAFVDAAEIKLFSKPGRTKPVLLKDPDQAPSTVYVKGISSFQPKKKQWPHPFGIIGCGYYGLKVASRYVMDGNTNFVMWDRNDRVGGYCWLTGANKTSRLQTDFGMFHLWWGVDSKEYKLGPPDCTKIMGTGPDKYHDPVKEGFSMWPYKWEINRMFQHHAEQYGLLSYAHLQTNVAKLDIEARDPTVNAKNSEDRYYVVTADSLVEHGKVDQQRCSVVYHFPGSLTKNRIIEYPGEEHFDGEIRYGMNDDTPYDKLKGSTIAILGNGAFAVENARTCLECEGIKAYIITRRKNLASPRVPCWFVHQGPAPTPGWMVLKTFQPMYEASNFGDPFDYWSVTTNEARNNVFIKQASRFGIGDVTFLMHAWGLLEYKVATVKRMSHHALHLSTGEVLEGVTIVLKALGLLGDYAVDRLHKMKTMVGKCPDGDWRRVMTIDDTGMDAQNFVTFSAGIGGADFCITWGYLYDHPEVFFQIKDAGFMSVLPTHKEEPDIEKPAYVCDVRHAMQSAMALDSMIPQMAPMKMWFMDYKYRMIHQSHPIDRFLEVAEFEWNTYQEEWKRRGHEHDHVPYPYNKEMISGWFKEWSEVMKIPIDIHGPLGKPPKK